MDGSAKPWPNVQGACDQRLRTASTPAGAMPAPSTNVAGKVQPGTLGAAPSGVGSLLENTPEASLHASGVVDGGQRVMAETGQQRPCPSRRLWTVCFKGRMKR